MATGLMLKKLVLKNLLSFGPEGVELELGPLNVLIGPNASGKSNLIDAIRLLAACPKDVLVPLAEGGGFAAWHHKRSDPNTSFAIDATVEAGEFGQEPLYPIALVHGLSFIVFSKLNAAFIHDESVESVENDGTRERVYSLQGDYVLSRARDNDSRGTTLEELGVDKSRSILSQVNRSGTASELRVLEWFYSEISIYSDWNVSRSSLIRDPQPIDLRSESLSSDATNLMLVLNRLDNEPGVSARLVRELKNFYPRATGIKTLVSSYGRVEAYIEEEGLRENVPFTRISDGTLRWLCLLTVLLHPEPPSLICLEEPEVGLHPDMLRRLAQLLVEASERTQLIVTTHSDLLVSALSDYPESIIVCEHLGGSTQFFKVEAEYLKKYIDEYALGDAWLKGELGGTRY